MTDPRTWYVVSVPPQAEFKIEAELRKLGHDAMVPVEYKWRRRNAHSKHKKRKAYPVFPRYVFTGTKGEPRWPEITSLQPAPVRPVSFGGKPAQLAQADVARLVTISSDKLPEGFNLHKAIKAGEVARIAAGPFAGHSAMVRKIEGDRAQMSVPLFGHDNAVLVSLDQLEAA